MMPANADNPALQARYQRLSKQISEVFEDVAGFDIPEDAFATSFIELGLDSLMLTQVALQLQKTFQAKITFRQLMGELGNAERLLSALDAQLPPDAQPAAPVAPAVADAPVALTAPVPALAPATFLPSASPALPVAGGHALRTLIAQQMQLMSQQLALLSGAGPAALQVASPQPSLDAAIAPSPAQPVSPPASPGTPVGGSSADEETALAHTRYDVKKAFGAIARIDAGGGMSLAPASTSTWMPSSAATSNVRPSRRPIPSNIAITWPTRAW